MKTIRKKIKVFLKSIYCLNWVRIGPIFQTFTMLYCVDKNKVIAIGRFLNNSTKKEDPQKD